MPRPESVGEWASTLKRRTKHASFVWKHLKPDTTNNRNMDRYVRALRLCEDARAQLTKKEENNGS